MPDIVLATVNARYIHASLGLRYLLANLGSLEERALIREFETSRPALEIVEQLVADCPRILGLGVYIWNIQRTTEVVRLLRRLRPDIVIVVGGPEVSYEADDLDICRAADYVISGEGDHAFRILCENILSGHRPLEKRQRASTVDVQTLSLPYSRYSAKDIAERVVYVEASRGCPFTCQFCLSSLDAGVRKFDTNRVLGALDELFNRGVRTFKFIDRTFNLNIAISTAILSFFLERMEPGLFAHFEMVPDRFPVDLRNLVKQFPAGSLQFEVGIQSFNPEVNKLIARRQDNDKVRENLSWLRSETGVHIHADLIAGLPSEDVASFARGFDDLVALDPQEIQVGILKRLRGTPLHRHEETYRMVYGPDAPYEILSTSTMNFETLQRLRRFSRYWDLVANSGNFVNSKRLLLETQSSAFAAFDSFSEWLFGQVGRRDSINLKLLAELVFRYLTEGVHVAPAVAGTAVAADYLRGGRHDIPRILAEFAKPVEPLRNDLSPIIPKRQRRAAAAA